MYRTTMFAVSVLVVLALPVATPAQSEAIPADVVALISRFSPMTGADAELRAGGPPAGFPLDVIPTGAVVNASLVSPTRGTSVVATAAGLSRAQVEQHWDGLTRAGWTALGPTFRGFIASPTGSIPTWALCRGTAFVTLSASVREAGGLHLRMAHADDTRRACVPSGMTSMMADVTIPRLVPPEGSRPVGGSGGGGGTDAMTSAARLETALTGRDVSRHYERQLVAAGWTVVSRLQEGRDLTILRFEVPSTAGLALVGWLSVSPLGTGGDIDVFLRVIRQTRDPRTAPTSSFTTMAPVR